MGRARGDDWELRAQGAETRYETYCRHNQLMRKCPCGEVFLPRRINQRYCDPSHRRYLSRLSNRAAELMQTERVVRAAAAALCNRVVHGVSDLWNSPITDQPHRIIEMRSALEAAVREAQKK